MNKAKTLKRRLGNPKPFLSVAWDTNDITSQLSVNPNLKWKDIDWQRVEKNVVVDPGTLKDSLRREAIGV